MSSAFPDVRAVIEALGGHEKAAADLGVGLSAVGNWLARNRLPADRYFAIRDLLAPHVVPDELWQMGRKPDRRRAQAVGAEA
jgi:DNA-binding transcriptional regulator YdaS (Cro superfamily)